MNCLRQNIQANARLGRFASALFCLAALVPGQVTSPRAARSVHLTYTAPRSTTFYNEMTVDETTPGSFFMACGFDQGYFGIQDLGSRKVVLFSVWDPEPKDDPGAVPADRRVETLYRADEVRVGRFGNEGSGGQSFFDFDWKVGEVYRFLVEAAVEGDKTSYGAWFYLNEPGVWKHLTTFRAITGGRALWDLHSFLEDFRRDGKSLHERRAARFGNGWARGMDGAWTSLTEARFSADQTTVQTIDAGAREYEFYLATGGDTTKHCELRSWIQRPRGNFRPPKWP